MQYSKSSFSALGLVVVCCSAQVVAEARSGLAAYHAHTPALVTAARYEPRGSVLEVTNPRNGRTVKVLVNDRGPFNGGRILDLSTGAFRQLFGGLGRGVGPITYRVVSAPVRSALTSRSGRSNGWKRSRKYRSSRQRSSRKYRKSRN